MHRHDRVTACQCRRIRCTYIDTATMQRYPFVRPQRPVTHRQLVNELEELEALGYDPAVGYDPAYPDNLNRAQRRPWDEYATDCPHHGPMATVRNGPLTNESRRIFITGVSRVEPWGKGRTQKSRKNRHRKTAHHPTSTGVWRQSPAGPHAAFRSRRSAGRSHTRANPTNSRHKSGESSLFGSASSGA